MYEVFLTMEAFFVSIGIIALAEIGDKTQLLAFILASRFQQPFPIIFGILAATLINHSLAGMVGVWITMMISPDTLRWLLAASFIGMAVWTLLPDKMDQDKALLGHKLGVFGATFVTFFLAEMGDKTQIATIALTAHYNAPIWVIAGTTLGMLLADVPAVYIGNKFATKIPMKVIHITAAVIFLLMGILSVIY